MPPKLRPALPRFLRVGLLGALAVASIISARVAAQTVRSPEPSQAASTVKFEQHEAVFKDYRFRDGETMPSLRVRYSTAGTAKRNGAGDIVNAVLLLHWTGANSTVMQSPQFIRSLYAPGQPLDATRYFLIFPDSIGHGNSSKPSDGLKARFPKYGYQDMVDLQHRLVIETLGIRRLQAILGLSMGGMNAWQWAEMYPDAMRGIMPVAALPAKLSGRNLLWRRIITNAIRNDPEWHDGNYDRSLSGWFNSRPLYQMMLDGVPRLDATITRASEADQYVKDAIDGAKQRDANDMLYSLESATDYDPEPSLAVIRAKVYALDFTDDEFYPEQLHALDRLMKEVQHGRYALEEGSPESFGHLTMAHPELWHSHVKSFMDALIREDD
jgi:homoserine O-acetyltransferase/O-succinyltransferase